MTLFEWIYLNQFVCPCVCMCVSSSLPPTCLDDELGTLIAWKKCHVNSAVFHISAVLIHYGVKLCMAHCRGVGE